MQVEPSWTELGSYKRGSGEIPVPLPEDTARRCWPWTRKRALRLCWHLDRGLHSQVLHKLLILWCLVITAWVDWTRKPLTMGPGHIHSTGRMKWATMGAGIWKRAFDGRNKKVGLGFFLCLFFLYPIARKMWMAWWGGGYRGEARIKVMAISQS